ncbi:amino acid transporter [Phyllobacterium salinisoli]|nr:amino acid transporter [Phyllobacterium salinisoli]
MTLIHNERTKLTGNYLNGIAIAIFAVGTFNPLVASIGAEGPGIATAITSVICFLASLALHLASRRILKGLMS